MEKTKMKVLKENAIKAYKAFDPHEGLSCLGFRYKVGETYTAKGKVALCKNGFHACEVPHECFDYKSMYYSVKFAEVLCWGVVEKSELDSKLCCSKIKIVRVIEKQEMYELCNLGKNNIGRGNVGSHNTGELNSGSFNRGKGNTGDKNEGSYCTGDHNVGSRNVGSYNFFGPNTGSFNKGEYNTNNNNLGDGNSGCCNHGNRNTGGWNVGDLNSGSWNKGNVLTGFFNTETPKQVLWFNKPGPARGDIDFPTFLFFDLTEWVCSSNMTEEEKVHYPLYIVTGGYLKELDYKKAFHDSFMRAKKNKDWPEQYALLKALPNFDYKIFEEISGITEKELEDSIKKFKKGKKK